VSLTLPSPLVAVKLDGGSAVDPLLHPLSKGVTMATINMQSNFFTVEFLMGDLFYFGIRGADSQRWIRFPQTHCCIQIGASQPRFETRLKITISCSLERQERYMTMKKNESNIVTRYYQYLQAARPD
jgi:hypothetical protein